MKQTSNLTLVGKKMTKESMKALKGGSRFDNCVDTGWYCFRIYNCCYDDPFICMAACGNNECMEAMCNLY
jgi:hypothetical protein